MRRLLVLILVTLFTNSLVAQTTAINESFDTWPAPNWNIYEIGAGGHWVHSTLFGSNRGYGGGNAAEHQISNDNCENWLVTPQITVSNSDYQLSFYEKAWDLEWYSWSGVYVSTSSGDPINGDFVALSECLQIDDDWVEHTVDLSSYVGEDIYLAFVYTGTWHHWIVDEVIVAPSSLIDGALIEIVNPTGIDPNAGIEDVIVKLHNYGTDPIEDVEIEWNINEVAQTSYEAMSLSLAPGESTNLNIGSYDFTTDGDYLLSFNLVLTDDANPSNDSIEDTFYVTEPKDAELTKISPSGYSSVSGEKDVIISVKNVGNYTITNVDIEWMINENEQTDFSSGAISLQVGEEIDFVVGQFDFENGLTEISSTAIVSGDENLSNNEKTSNVAINILWESFEGEMFPPEMWRAKDYPLQDYWYSPPHGEFYYHSMTDDNMFGEISDTLWTPLLDIQLGDQIYFWVNNSAFYTNDDKLIYKDGTTNVISEIGFIDSQLEQWDYVIMDISDAAGINYIGFVNNSSSGFGASSIDMITSDASIYQFTNDIGINNFQFDNIAPIENAHEFNVKIRNYGSNSVDGSSYTIKLYDVTGELLSQSEGVNLEEWEEAIIIINHTFLEINTYDVYAEVDFANDEYSINNISESYNVSSVPAGYQSVELGFAEFQNLSIPFNTGGSAMSLGQDDVSQVLYFKEELPIDGYLYGVKMYYYELFAVGQYLPLQVWVKHVDLDDMSNGWVPTEEMQMVFNDTINVYAGENSVYIPFDDPILMTSTNDLLIQYHQYNPSWPFTACRFYATADTDGTMRSISLTDVYNLDVYDLPDYWGEHTNYPYTKFIYEPIDGSGVISGFVYDENDQPIEGVKLSVAGTGIEEYTFANGDYTLPELPYETYDITASYLGYNDFTQSQTINEDEENLDFYLLPLPKINVSGTVVGSNDLGTPLEGVMVTLDGYESLLTFTDENGEYVFEDVYGNHDYVIECSYYGYHTYSDSVSFDETDYAVGEIILLEEFISAYHIVTTADATEATIEWMEPITSQKVKMQKDMNNPSNSFTNEPGENVWLGNKFENDGVTTLTSVEILFDIYELAHDFVSVDILDENGNRIVTSKLFLTHHDSLMTIDIPNISLEGDFYAMVHWKNLNESTDALTIDYTEGIENSAYIMYPNEEPVLLSDFLGGWEGSWFVRVNTLMENPEAKNRNAISYNIYKGLASEIAISDQWTALNTFPITDLVFIDETWSNSDPQTYTYAVEAIYTEGLAEYSFSNFVSGFTNVIEIEEDDIDIYPNPANSIINISGIDKANVIIYNILGKIVFSSNSDEFNSQIDVSNFENGNYIIKVDKGQSQTVKKLVVTN